MRLKRVLGVPAVLLVAGSLSVGLAAAPSAASARSVARLLVAATPSAQLGPCKSATYTTIQSAVDAASPGDVVVVCTGTYNEDVKLTKPITLLGTGNPVIDATGQDNGILVVASGATVEGLTVENATGEGILAVSVHNVTIEHNVVQHNDLGTPTSSYLECQATQGVPGDCGEGLHLMGVADSQVLDNVVRDNSGGILLTDETGPTHGNLVEGNVVDGNAYDCGITMPSHNGKAVTASGTLQPTLGGVYDNTVTRNVIFDNGLADGAGAGVLIADPFPGTADYNNTVSDNTIEGNGNPGVTMHEHAPGTYLGGNVITGNTILTNNVEGDPTSGDTATTGIVVYANNAAHASPIHVTVTGNLFEGDVWGIWETAGTVLTQAGNTLLSVNGLVHQAA